VERLRERSARDTQTRELPKQVRTGNLKHEAAIEGSSIGNAEGGVTLTTIITDSRLYMGYSGFSPFMPANKTGIKESKRVTSKYQRQLYPYLLTSTATYGPLTPLL